MIASVSATDDNMTNEQTVDSSNYEIQSTESIEKQDYDSTNVKTVNETENTKEDVIITQDSISDVAYEDNITISGHITDTNGKNLNNETIVITVNNNAANITTDANGKYSYSTKSTIIGINNVTTGFNGNEEYNELYINSTFNVIRQDLVISIDPIEEVAYNDVISISGRFTDKNDKTLANTLITLNINNNTVKTKTNDESIFNYTTNIKTLGLNTITASYPGNNKYNPISSNTTFNVIKQDVILTLNPISELKYKDEVNITGKFTDKNANPLANTNIKVKLNNKTVNAKTNKSGEFTYTTYVTIMGQNNVSVSYPGNAKYGSDSANTTFNVIKQDLLITVTSVKEGDPQNNVTITGKLTDKNGKILINTNVKITINNKTKTAKTNNNGIFTLNTNVVINNSIDITTSHKGNAKYNPTNSTVTFEDPDVRLSDSEIHPGVEKTFLALLPEDCEGKSVFKINKKTISEKLESEYGILIYNYMIPESYQSEEYTLYLVYSGDSKYIGKTVNATLTLTPEGGRVNASMSMKNFTIKYLTPSELLVKLDSNAFGKIIFKANDTNISSVKFANGSAKYNYTTKLTPGVYTLTATYTGNYMYTQTVINSTLRVNKIGSTLALKDVSSKAGKNTVFKATVTDELNNYVKDMNVTFRLDGKIIGSNITNKNGFVKLYYTLPSSLYNKTYNITASGAATVTTLSSKNESTLTLKQLKTKVSVPNISTKPSKTVIISATVVDEFNNYVSKGVVTFKKSGKTLGQVNVSNGFAKFVYTTNYQTSNKTRLYAYYVGDWKYASSKGNGTYEVTQLKTTISPSSVDAKPNSQITLKAIIRDQNQNYASDGKVKFTLNNTVLKTVSVNNGIATMKYTLKDYPAGTYRIKVEYLGSKIYKASSNTNTMTVTRYATTIKGSEFTAVVGSKSSISLTVIDEEKYNVNSGNIKYYINSEYVGSARVSNGVSTLEYTVPSQYDGKTVKYYATYEKNGIYDSTSYSDNLVVTHQKTVYVSPNGSDSNLGDKAHPFKTIPYAIDHISLFGTVQLEAGTYYVSGLQLNTSVNIIGSGRDKTIIDGKNSGSPVFNMTKRNAVLTIKGVTIQNAKSNSQFSAGAIVTSAKLNILNSRFVNNTGSGEFSGGAIYTNGILNVTNTQFINNKVTNVNSQGGAIRCYDNTTYITNCKFESNQVTGTNSTGAAAIYGDYSDIIINRTKFTKNIAKGKYITGGVIRSIAGAVILINSSITNNQITATDYAMGGAIGSLSSGISIMNSTINSNTVKATNSAGGSVIYVETAALDIKDSKLNSNTVSAKNTYGGTIYSYKANVNIRNTQANNNKVTDTDNAYGGAVYAYDGQLNITNTNFTSNSIKSNNLALAGAVYSYATTIIKNSNFEKNTINASSLGGGAIANMGSLNITHTNFIDNYAYNAGNAITATETSINNIENNYWGSSSPSWSDLLYSVTQPKSYSKSKY